MRKRKKRRIGINTVLCRAVFLASLFALVLPAQKQAPVISSQHAGTPITRSIEGTIFNKEGAIVPHAIVLLKDTKTLQVRSFIAETDGRYHFYGLSPDINYQLRAESNNVTSSTKTVSVFDSHQKVKLDLKLKKEMKKK